MNTVTLLLFTAINCIPCGKLAEQLDAVSTIEQQKYTVQAVFAYDDLSAAEHYNITMLPTMILLDRHGNEQSRRVGYLTKHQVENWFDLVIQ